jgi:hypothetical protein
MSRFFHRLCVVALVLIPLCFIGFIIWRLNLAHKVNIELAAIRAAGLPTDGVEANAYYPSVPDSENAALKMEQAFDLMANYHDRRSNQINSISIPYRKDVLTADQRELIGGYCAMNSNALMCAGEAIKLPRCRYPVDLSWGVSALLPHLPKLKALALVAGYQAELNPNDSVHSISTILGMAHTLDKEPILISKLVRFAMVEVAIVTLERCLNNPEEVDGGDLGRLQEQFAGVEDTNQIASGLIGERAMMIRYFRMSFAEASKLANADADTPSAQEAAPLPGPQPIILKLTGFFERDLRFYLQAMQTNIVLAETYPKNISAITNIQARIWETSGHNWYLLSSLLLPAMDSAVFREASEVAHVRTAQAALAVERFRKVQGRLPENLNDLVPQFLPAVPEDPFDGQPLRYHLLKKGYVIYSVGRDGHDNNGRERPAKVKSSDRTEYDITFIVER